MVADKNDDVDQLRDGFKEAFAVVSKLATHIQSTEDLARVIQLALDDDAQLRFLLSLITAPAKK